MGGRKGGREEDDDTISNACNHDECYLNTCGYLVQFSYKLANTNT